MQWLMQTQLSKGQEKGDSGEGFASKWEPQDGKNVVKQYFLDMTDFCPRESMAQTATCTKLVQDQVLE